MAQKTNKSYTKRLKKTRRNKLIARAPGQDHFNSRENGQQHQQRKRAATFDLSSKDRGRFLPHS